METRKPLTMDFVHKLEDIVVIQTQCDMEVATVVVCDIMNEVYKDILKPIYDQVDMLKEKLVYTKGDG